MTGHEMDAYELLEKKTREIEVEGYLTSNKKIRELLDLIAKNKVLNRIVKESASKVDFDLEFSKATTHQSGSNFIIPNHPYKAMCLITGVLFKMDKLIINMIQFIREFYSTDSISVGFKVFCSKIFPKYLISVKSILEGNVKEIEVDDEVIKETKKERKYLRDSINEELMIITSAIKELLNQDNSIKEPERIDLIEIIKGFDYASENEVTLILYPLWISLKKLIPNKREYQKHIQSIENIFKKYEVFN